MPKLIEQGYLYLAVPPLYRLTQGARSEYARDDDHKAELLAKAFPRNSKVEVSRFKGLGEMPPAQLKATTMNPKTRTLLRVTVFGNKNEEDDPPEFATTTSQLVETLMGRKPELRFAYIQKHARFVEDVDV
jgi:topoisomerase-4 subunit B